MEFLERAMEWAKENKPSSSMSHKAAFANSVDYLMSGAVGGYGGPSIRQYAVDYALAGDGDRIFLQTNVGEILAFFPDARLPRPGEWSFDRAVAFCEPICFGPLKQIHRTAWREQGDMSFDNDPQDLIELEGK